MRHKEVLDSWGSYAILKLRRMGVVVWHSKGQEDNSHGNEKQMFGK